MDISASKTRRTLFFALLYFSEGAPIGFIWWALPAHLREAGIPVDRITEITAVLVLPWALKFLWAPLIDALRTPRWHLRSWIIAAQVMMGGALVPLLFWDITADLELLAAFLLVHTFAAATQDVAIDALCIATVPGRERGSVNGWMQAGMLLGRSLFGGGTLVLASLLGQQWTAAFLIGAVWACVVVVVRVRGTREPAIATTNAWHTFSATLREASARRSTWYGLAFAVVGGTAYEAVGAVAGPFLVDRGFASQEVGYFFALPAVVSMLAGAVAGGYVADRMGARKAVTMFTLFVSTSVVMLALLDSLNVAGAYLVVSLGVVYLGIGMFTASSYALFMDLTDPRLGATQFSAYMGGTNLCEAWAGFAVGKVIAWEGYGLGFVAAGLVSLGAVFLLRKLNPGRDPSSGN